MSDVRDALGRWLQQLAAALRAAALYPEGHPAIHTPLRHIASDLAMRLRHQDRVLLGRIDDVLVVDEMPFYEARSRFRPVFEALERHRLEAIAFEPGVTLRELETLVGLLGEDAGPGQRILDAAKQRELTHIVLRECSDEDDRRARARRTYESSLAVVVDLMSEIRMGKIPSSGRATAVVDGMRDLILTDESALLGLTLLKDYDEYTYNHSVNVAIFSLAYAKHRELPPEEMRRVGLAGLLHDVGKVRTSERIVKKPGALTPEEMRIMQLHPELGAEILEAMRGIDSETEEIVLYHHLRHDRSGYPKPPPGHEPHPHAEIVALADCYDALTTTRPYQKPRHPSEALRVIRRLQGRAYAPANVEAFVEMLGTYPVGELVRLSTNELAVVCEQSHLDPTSPRVRIVTDACGRPLAEPVACDLASAEAKGRRICASVDPLRKGIDVARALGL